MTTTNEQQAYAALDVNYLDGVKKVIERVESTQMAAIEQAAEICFNSINQDGLVHLFGSGHSRMAVEEMYPRYGSFPGFHPMVELSLTNHHAVVGSNGQRQAMFLENVEGFGRVIADEVHYGPHDSMMLFSHSGAGSVVIDIALSMKERNIPVIAVTSVGHSELSRSKHSSGYRLFELADIVIDNGAVPGDAMVKIDGLHTPVGPGSTIGNTIIVNLIKCKVAQQLTSAGKPPKVLTSSIFVGDEESKRLFNASYEEYWRTTRSI
ncbi:sugar isomerase domain-containing protein [Paenibacillus sp. GCM10023252]|uniref:sugar isomerase domain-containing protein n=1 Tax=Paenibacillus sp. GCM10023252 TaxID=3252649 RepID=UPI0036073852